MSALRWYLLRLVACSFVVALSSALITAPRLQRIVRLGGGCLLALLALQPLFSLDLAQLPDYLYDAGLSQQYFTDQAEEKNAEILEQLIRQQTDQRIEEAFVAQGISADFTLSLHFDERVGAPIPWAIVVQGTYNQAQRQALTAFLRDELGIPEERQQWRSR